MATRKTGGKKAVAGAAKKAAPRRRTRKAPAGSAPEPPPAPAAPARAAEAEASAGTVTAAESSPAAPQGALVEVARTIGSTLGAIAATTRGALHKNKPRKKKA